MGVGSFGPFGSDGEGVVEGWELGDWWELGCR